MNIEFRMVKFLISFKKKLTLPFNKVPKNVCIIRNDGLGDYFLFEETLQNIIEYFATAKVDVVVSKLISTWITLTVDSSNIKVEPSKGILKIIKFSFQLMFCKYDLVIVPKLDRTWKDSWYSFISLAPYRVCFTDKSIKTKRVYLTKFLYNYEIKLDYLKHESLNNQYFFNSLFNVEIKRKKAFPKLIRISDEEINKLLNFKINNLKRFIIVFPGGSKKSKRWEINKLKNLILSLYPFKKLGIIILLGPGEQDLIKEFKEIINSNIFLLYNISPTKVSNIFLRVNYYLGNDTGIAHLAAILGLSTLTLSINGNSKHFPSRFEPLTNNRINIMQTFNKTIDNNYFNNHTYYRNEINNEFVKSRLLELIGADIKLIS